MIELFHCIYFIFKESETSNDALLPQALLEPLLSSDDCTMLVRERERERERVSHRGGDISP